MKKREIDTNTPTDDIYPIGNGRYVLNARNGIACTLTGAHHYAGNITHPRYGFREMGVLEIAERRVTDALIMAIRNRSEGDWHSSEHRQNIEIGTDVSNSLTSVAKDNYVVEFYEE